MTIFRLQAFSILAALSILAGCSSQPTATAERAAGAAVASTPPLATGHAPVGPIETWDMGDFGERKVVIFRDPDGNATRVFGIDLDVTDRALQLEAERDNAAALQMALLPSAFSLVSGYRLDAQYLAASTRDRLGGDFYDARTRQGTLTLVVGDVAGHGLAATAQMSTVQYMLRTLIAQHGGAPGAVLDEAAVLFADVCHDESFVTALVVHVTLDSGTVRVASAGHPPPLMSVDGQPRLLEGLRPGPPLGLVHRRPIAELVTTLAAGEWIALFTDGVFERRDISITDSIDMALRRLPPQPSAADFITAGDVPSRATDDRAVIVLHRNRVVD